MNGVVPDDWTQRLAAAIAAALKEFRPTLGDTQVSMFTVGCYPWHRSLELSLLTAGEASADPALADPKEMASWRHYDFSVDLPAWRPAADLGREMGDVYYGQEPEAPLRPVADAFHRACAAAAASAEVTESLAQLNRSERFRISVSHVDDGQEYFPG